MNQWNFEDKKKSSLLKFSDIVLILIFVIAVSFIFIGCAKPQQQCKDGHIYSVSPQKVELLKENGCQ